MPLVHRPGAVAFRLVNELEGILEGIRADGVIDGGEVLRLQSWLTANAQFAEVRPFSEMAQMVRLALRDGVLSMDECDDLLFVCQRLTTVNPHFHQVRAGVQVLMGVLAGIASDGQVTPSELNRLSDWIEQWSHLKTMWPFDECESVVTTIIARGRVDDDARELLALAEQLPLAGDSGTDDVPLVIHGVCAVDPLIEFLDRSFVFTGESSKATRDELVEHVVSRGGMHHPNVRRDSNYLIVSDAGSPCWAFSCYGRKVEKAMEHRRSGNPVVIVHENDFWDAIA